MRYTVKELDVAKCEFVKKLEAAAASHIWEYEGEDTFFGYYRRVTALIGEYYVEVRLIHSKYRVGIVSWDGETKEYTDLTLEEFKNLEFPAV